MEVKDDVPDILDVPKDIRHEFTVNCRVENSGFNEQKI